MPLPLLTHYYYLLISGIVQSQGCVFHHMCACVSLCMWLTTHKNKQTNSTGYLKPNLYMQPFKSHTINRGIFAPPCSLICHFFFSYCLQAQRSTCGENWSVRAALSSFVMGRNQRTVLTCGLVWRHTQRLQPRSSLEYAWSTASPPRCMWLRYSLTILSVVPLSWLIMILLSIYTHKCVTWKMYCLSN